MNSQERDQRLHEIIASYLEAEESGRPPDRGEFLARHPEWQAELKLFLSNRDKLAHAFGELGGMGTPSLPKSEREISTLSAASARPANWQPGDKIADRWQVQQVLGGGMGIVYVVKDEHTGEQLAAKTYRDDVLAMNPNLAARFEREALAWINLDPHPNIVQAKFIKTIHQKPYLFLEFIEGGSLRAMLPSLHFPAKNSVEEIANDDWQEIYKKLARIKKLALDFCDGMIHVARFGIKAHRDIKAENCLIINPLSDTPILKITDFGLAKLFDDAVSTADLPFVVTVPTEPSISTNVTSEQTTYHLPVPEGLSIFVTCTGAAAGTPSHMAPEQFDNLKHVDARADVYSFGVLLFQMITGRLPFLGPTWLDYKRQHQSINPPSCRLLGHDDVGLLVDRCLEKQPESRFASFFELRIALEETIRTIRTIPIADHKDDQDDQDEMYTTAWDPRYADDLWSWPELVTRGLTEDELLNKGFSLSELGRHQESLMVFKRVIEQNPNNAVAWREKGLLLMKVFRDYNEALLSLHRANQLGDTGAQEHIAFCQSKVSHERKDIKSAEFAASRVTGPEVVGEIRCFAGQGHITDLSFTHSGRELLSGTMEGEVGLWDVETGALRHTLTGHDGPVWSVQMSPSDQFALSAGSDGTIRTWDLSTGQQLRCVIARERTARHNRTGLEPAATFAGKVANVALGRDARSAVFCTKDGELYLWHDYASNQYYPRFWAMNQPEVYSVFPPEKDGVIHGIIYSPYGYQHIICGTRDGKLKVWRLAWGLRAPTLLLSGHVGPVGALAISSDGRWLLSGGHDNTVRLWDLTSGSELRCFAGHVGCVHSVALAENALAENKGRLRDQYTLLRLLSGSDDHTLRCWLGTGTELCLLKGHTDRVRCVALSDDGRLAASASDDCTLRVWRLPQCC
jgi:serine/threonine protein kinase